MLIIEDDPTLREIYSLALELDGYHVLKAEHGQAALDMLLNLNSRYYPKCILMDLKMPVMDGKTFLQRMDEEFSHKLGKIPVIICSAYGDYVETKQVISTLRKPIELDTLSSTIHMALTHTIQ